MTPPVCTGLPGASDPIPVPVPGDNRIGAISGDIATQGWSWQPDFLPDALAAALRAEIFARDAERELTMAGIGREDAFQLDRSVRLTRISWMDGSSAAQRAFFDWTEQLNEDWTNAKGGALVIWPERASETDAPAARLLPLGSGVAFMLSETVPHAVEVTHARRYAIAGWWRVNQSGDARVDPIS